MITKKVKNNSGGSITRKGQVIADQEYYELQPLEEKEWRTDTAIQAEITAGTLVINDGTSDLNATDGLDHFKAEDATCIRQVPVDDSAKADGYALKYDSASGKIIYGPSAASASDQAVSQARRTTTLAGPATYTDVTFDVTDVQNDASTIEHDSVTNTDRITVKETGLSKISYQGSLLVDGGDTYDFRVRVNDTTVLAGSEICNGGFHNGDHISDFNLEFYAELTANDYLSLQFQAGGTSTILAANAHFTVQRCSGEIGATGATGIAGADGDMTWEGNWVSQNYTANQAVKYTNGNSYVCHTNTTSSQVPTDTNYWDVLAEKGDAGAAGSSGAGINLSFFGNNNDHKNATSGTYASVAKFIFEGSALLGAPTKIYANQWVTAGTAKIRIYDVTNNLTIAEATGISSTSTGNIVDLGTISNVPTGQALFEVQYACNGADTTYISTLSVEF